MHVQHNIEHYYYPTKLTSSTAEPTAQARGLPPYVLECIALISVSAISVKRQRAKDGGRQKGEGRGERGEGKGERGKGRGRREGRREREKGVEEGREKGGKLYNTWISQTELQTA